MKLKHIDHIGVVVNDLSVAKEFFLDLGFTIQGEAEEQSDLLDKVVDMQGARSQVVFLEVPDGQTKLELTKFLNPESATGEKESVMYKHGYRHLALEVENIDEIVEKMRSRGADIFVDVYNYRNMYKLCYLRGPEGLLIELAEEL